MAGLSMGIVSLKSKHWNAARRCNGRLNGRFIFGMSIWRMKASTILWMSCERRRCKRRRRSAHSPCTGSHPSRRAAHRSLSAGNCRVRISLSPLLSSSIYQEQFRGLRLCQPTSRRAVTSAVQARASEPAAASAVEALPHRVACVEFRPPWSAPLYPPGPVCDARAFALR